MSGEVTEIPTIHNLVSKSIFVCDVNDHDPATAYPEPPEDPALAADTDCCQ